MNKMRRGWIETEEFIEGIYLMPLEGQLRPLLPLNHETGRATISEMHSRAKMAGTRAGAERFRFNRFTVYTAGTQSVIVISLLAPLALFPRKREYVIPAG